MEKISKAKLDKAIEEGRKFFRGDYQCNCEPYTEAKIEAFEDNMWHWAGDILNGLIIKRDDYDEPNETFYKVFEALGFEIVEG